jgi:hypothetical protein
MYYGIGMPVDFVRARQCAYAQPVPPRGVVMGGSEILMMVYANGRGVPANFDLALHFACKIFSAPAELELRVARLSQARTKAQLDDTMDICDEATSGYMSGYCAAHRERVDAVARNARRLRATAGMPERELNDLKHTALRYFRAHSESEIDQTGSARAMFAIQEQARLDDELVSVLERLRNPDFPPDSGDAKALYAELAALMKRVASCKTLTEKKAMYGFITSAGIRETQDGWLPYRRAFIALAVKVRPETQSEAWQAWLDAERLRLVRELASGC